MYSYIFCIQTIHLLIFNSMQNISYRKKLKAEEHDSVHLEILLIKEGLVYTLLISKY